MRSTSDQESNAKTLRGARGFTRRAMAASASLLVVGVAVVYLVAPTEIALGISVKSQPMTKSAHLSKTHEVMYGKVLTSAGKGIAKASISVDSRSFETSGRGVFRGLLALPNGVYTVGCTAHTEGTTLRASINASLKLGRAYHLTCRVNVHNVLYIFPVGSY